MKDIKITAENKTEKGKKKQKAGTSPLAGPRDPVGSGQGGHGLNAPAPAGTQETQEKPKDKPKK
jgi:hypothetical protein